MTREEIISKFKADMEAIPSDIPLRVEVFVSRADEKVEMTRFEKAVDIVFEWLDRPASTLLVLWIFFLIMIFKK